MPLRATRSRAFSSIESDRSMPVTAQSRGYSAGVDAGADADLEHAIARLDAHALDRLQPAGVQRGTEGEVVHRGEVLVNAGDEVVLDGSDRQRAGGRVGPRELFVSGAAGSNSGMRSPQADSDRLKCSQSNQRPVPQSESSDYTSGPSAKSIKDRQRGIDVPGLGGDLNALHALPQAAQSRAQSRCPRPPRASWPSARRIRSISASGTRTPGTSFAMNSALRATFERKHAGNDRQRASTRSASGTRSKPPRSKTGRVTTNSAPASTL